MTDDSLQRCRVCGWLSADPTADVIATSTPDRRMPPRSVYAPLIKRARRNALARMAAGTTTIIDDKNRCEFAANLYEQLASMPDGATAYRGMLVGNQAR